jgi:tetratricopeptide (TPR) repeat protein
VRLWGFSGILLLGLLAAGSAFAQQAKFDPGQCEGRSAQDCNDLMGSFDLAPQEREKVLLTRATALLQKHDLEGSIAEYREMTVIDPHSLIAYSTLGFLESIGEKWKEAVPDLQRAVEIAPDQGRLRGMLAVALAKTGDCNGAASALAEAKKAPDAATVAKSEQVITETCR